MIRPQRLLSDRQSAKVEGLGLGVGPLSSIQLREVIEAGGGTEMIGPQRLLPDRQSAKVERLGLGVGALVVVERCQVVKAKRCIGMIWP